MKHYSVDVVLDFVGDLLLSVNESVRNCMSINDKQSPRFEVKHVIDENDLVNLSGVIYVKNERDKDILDEVNNVCELIIGK